MPPKWLYNWTPFFGGMYTLRGLTAPSLVVELGRVLRGEWERGAVTQSTHVAPTMDPEVAATEIKWFVCCFTS